MSLQDSSAPHTVRGYGVNIQSFEVLAREHISGSRLMVVVRSKVRPRTLHRRVRVGHVGIDVGCCLGAALGHAHEVRATSRPRGGDS